MKDKIDIYILKCKYIRTSIQVNMENIDSLLYNDYVLFKGGIDYDNFKIKCVVNEGKYFTDILSTYYPPYILISEKLKYLLIENYFTGWKLYNVDLYSKKNIKINEKYYLLSVIGRSGKVNYKNRKIIKKQHFENGPIEELYKGFNIDMRKWDGSDFFVPENSYGIYVSKKVKEVLIENNISNLTFENINESETPVSWIKM